MGEFKGQHGGKRPGAGRKATHGESKDSADTRRLIALANLREFEVDEKRGNLGDRMLLARVLAAQHRLARDAVQTAPSREAATVAAELGLELRVVLPALEGFVRRILLTIAAPEQAQRAFLDATAPAQEAPAA